MGIGHSSGVGFTQLQDLLTVLCCCSCLFCPSEPQTQHHFASFQLELIGTAKVSSSVPFSPAADLPLGGKPGIAAAWQALVMVHMLHKCLRDTGSRRRQEHIAAIMCSALLLPCLCRTGAHT